MSKRKKPPNAGKGRKAGVPNRITKDVREAFKLLVEGNVGRVQRWLDEIAEHDPARALDAVLKLTEFVLPKLARHELTDRDGAPLNFMVVVPPKAQQQNAAG